MHYYDELGLTPDASADQIKEAYRNLVRLLHPDQQREPALQAVAEQQIKRLNRIYDVLSDPERRAQYDRDSADDRPLVFIQEPPRQPFFRRSSTAWTFAVVAFMMLLLWMASRQVSPNDGERESGADLVPVVAAQPPSNHEALDRRLEQVSAERDAALAKLAAAQSPPEHSLAREKTAASITLPGPAPELKPDPAPVPVVVAASLPGHPIAGDWVYRQSNAPRKNKDLYPPEFIETSISEDNGQLHGNFRARYRAPDRPVSPDVQFHFAGKLTGDPVSLPWNGTGGSKGEVTIRLTADHSLRLDWVASQLGDLGFYKGTALLVKKNR